MLAFVLDAAWHGRWTRRTASRREGDAASDARHWALRMVYVQFALVYFWTGFTKIDPVWLTGDTLHQLTASAENQALINRLADTLGVSHGHIHVWASWAVMIGELGATLLFLWRRLWWVGLLIVPWFHVGVEIIGFDIELFSYYMILMDVILLAPRRVYTTAEALGAGLAARLAVLRDRLAGWPAARGARLAVGVTAAAGATALAALLPYEGATTVAIAVAVLTLHSSLARGAAVVPVAVVHVAIAGLMFASAALSDVPYDYYRLWGGDLKKRGEIDLAIEMYQRANTVNDGPARLQQLGDLLARKGQHAEARAAYAEAVARNERALQAEKTASFKDPANPERHYDLAERYLTLVSRTDALASALRRAGEADKAAEVSRARAGYLADGRASLNEARRLDPRSGRAGGLLRELQRLDRR
ncbi:MAG: HTTM domain-containing protein [bacterium]